MTLAFGEVVLIRIPFQEAPGAKVRPAAVLLDSGDDDFVAAPITSRAQSFRYDLVVRDWSAAGLNVASWIRVHKLTVLTKASIVRPLGQLSESDRASLASVVRDAFCADRK